jgi:hypothetical protein
VARVEEQVEMGPEYKETETGQLDLDFILNASVFWCAFLRALVSEASRGDCQYNFSCNGPREIPQ